MSGLLLDTVEKHKSGEAVGVYSVCSAHPLVIEASVMQAFGEDGYLLVEATSNQVDQFGGYTGMKPRDFRKLMLGLAERRGLCEDRVVLGGDHLGPNRWRGLPAEEAMGHAGDLVALYVASGFTKIHLDWSRRTGRATILAGPTHSVSCDGIAIATGSATTGRIPTSRTPGNACF